MNSPKVLFASYTSWTVSGERNVLSKKQAATHSESRISEAIAQFSYTVNNHKQVKSRRDAHIDALQHKLAGSFILLCLSVFFLK